MEKYVLTAFDKGSDQVSEKLQAEVGTFGPLCSNNTSLNYMTGRDAMGFANNLEGYAKG